MSNFIVMSGKRFNYTCFSCFEINQSIVIFWLYYITMELTLIASLFLDIMTQLIFFFNFLTVCDSLKS